MRECVCVQTPAIASLWLTEVRTADWQGLGLVEDGNKSWMIWHLCNSRAEMMMRIQTPWVSEVTALPSGIVLTDWNKSMHVDLQVIDTHTFIELDVHSCCARSWHSSTSVAPKTVLGAVALGANVILTLLFKVKGRKMIKGLESCYPMPHRRRWVLFECFLTKVDLRPYCS